MRGCWKAIGVWQLLGGGDGDADMDCEGQGQDQQCDEVRNAHFGRCDEGPVALELIGNA